MYSECPAAKNLACPCYLTEAWHWCSVAAGAGSGYPSVVVDAAVAVAETATQVVIVGDRGNEVGQKEPQPGVVAEVPSCDSGEYSGSAFRKEITCLSSQSACCACQAAALPSCAPEPS